MGGFYCVLVLLIMAILLSSAYLHFDANKLQHNAMGECSAYSSLQADSKVKFAALPTSWRPLGGDQLLSR